MCSSSCDAIVERSAENVAATTTCGWVTRAAKWANECASCMVIVAETLVPFSSSRQIH